MYLASVTLHELPAIFWLGGDEGTQWRRSGPPERPLQLNASERIGLL